MAKTTAEQELQSVAQSIVEEDDYDRAMQALSRLKALKLKLLNLISLMRTLPPPEFKCPISGQLMIDPVVIASGETFDRPSIEKWLEDGNQTCPQTEEFLSHLNLIPDFPIKKMISRWCKEHEIELPSTQQDVDEETVRSLDSVVEEWCLSSLFEKLSSSTLADQKMAAKEIRQITKRSPSYRAHIGELPNAISNLVEPLSSGIADMDPELQEDLVKTILCLSLNHSNKMLLAKKPAIIRLIIHALKFGSIETRRSAAATLLELSSLESNKFIIGGLGAFEPLIELLKEGHRLVMPVAASAIFSLCILQENKSRAVSGGAVGVIMKRLMDQDYFLMGELLDILALLASHQKAIEEMAQLGAVSFLLHIIRENTSERSKENCIAILYTMCFNDPAKLREIKKEEDANGTLSRLARGGTSRAKRRANGLLDRLHQEHCNVRTNHTRILVGVGISVSAGAILLWSMNKLC